MIDRLTSRHDFARLRSAGRRADAGVVWCRFVPDAAAVPPRVAFALPRRVGNAVVRNRIKRRLRPILDAAHLAPGLWLFGVSSPTNGAPSIDQLSWSSLRELVDDLVARQTSIRRGSTAQTSTGQTSIGQSCTGERSTGGAPADRASLRSPVGATAGGGSSGVTDSRIDATGSTR